MYNDYSHNSTINFMDSFFLSFPNFTVDTIYKPPEGFVHIIRSSNSYVFICFRSCFHYESINSWKIFEESFIIVFVILMCCTNNFAV